MVPTFTFKQEHLITQRPISKAEYIVETGLIYIVIIDDFHVVPFDHGHNWPYYSTTLIYSREQYSELNHYPRHHGNDWLFKTYFGEYRPNVPRI